MKHPELLAPEGSLRAMDTNYYSILGGGARLRLLEVFFDLQIPELLGHHGPMPAQQICVLLGLNLDRGWKFLHLLALSGLLEESNGVYSGDETLFGLSADAKYFFGPAGTEGFFYRDLVEFWKKVANLSLIDVLRGAPLPEGINWPYATRESVAHFEYYWMRLTAAGSIDTLLMSQAVAKADKLLDIGGGDGTVGCALCSAYPHMQVTVFNLPVSAELALAHIAERQMTQRVHVHEGDFFKDEFPTGFDHVLFNRTLADWQPTVCKMLFDKVRRSMAPGGKLVINEAMLEGNTDFTLAWEFRYIFYDSYGRALFKPLSVYKQLLEDAGFRVTKVTPMRDEAFYSVIEAEAVT